MYLQIIKEQIERELDTFVKAKAGAWKADRVRGLLDRVEHFESVKEKYLPLQNYDSPSDVAEVLLDRDRSLTSLKCGVVWILIDQFQKGDDKVWGSILTLGFYPFLATCAKRLTPFKSMAEDEREMLVLESFYDAANAIRLEKVGDTALVNLVLGTNKRVGAYISKMLETNNNEVLMSSDEMDQIESDQLDPEQILLRAETAEEIYKVAKDRMSSEERDVVGIIFESIVSDDSIANRMKSYFGGMEPEAFFREYRRITKKMARISKKMKASVSKS